jgi:alkylation response protein AidB-like acyl-CoA dehydrogenase
MALAVSPEHEELRQQVRRWLDAHCGPEVVRSALEDPGTLPGVWKELAGQGWLGLHLPEAFGGQGFGLAEFAVVAEEFGFSSVPGPVLPTATVGAVVARYGTEDQQLAALPGLADGSTPAALALGAGSLATSPGPDGGVLVTGTVAPVLGAPGAALLFAPLDGGGWCLAPLTGPGIVVEALEPLDATRSLGTVTLGDVAVGLEGVFAGLSTAAVHELALVLAAAESAGGARWCLETASDYAKVRVQFGRPIGQFQAVKHKLADMLVAVEQAAAVAWDGAQVASAGPPGPAGSPGAGPDSADELALCAAVAGSVALGAFAHCAKDCIQILGGIGFTWEHDAHLYLKRAMATRALLGDADVHDQRVARLALDGVRRDLAADLPVEAETLRPELAALVADAARQSGAAQRTYLVDHGLVAPHWPAPWGRDAGPLEQLVLDEELAAAHVRRPHLGIGAWALPTLINHGTAAQQERWVRPTLLGEIAWCQLFSEPGAGSDLAALSTRAERVDGGWELTGQKVWTSLAQSAQFGICLARTDPDVPKHDGITFFVVDMASAGIDIRPLRELTGQAMFNEVFLDAVFVPDENVIGALGEGWRIARTTLANERVSMSSGSAFGIGVVQVLKGLRALGNGATPAQALRVGELLSEAQSLGVMAQRATLQTLSGVDPGAGSSVRKLLGAEHEQRVQELGLMLSGPAAASTGDVAGRWDLGFLATRCLTIAGGTSEVQRNVIAERLLGQLKDPEPGS